MSILNICIHFSLISTRLSATIHRRISGRQMLVSFRVLIDFVQNHHTHQLFSAPTTSCRTSVGVAVLDGFLYAVGGQDGVQCLNHVERYDPKGKLKGRAAFLWLIDIDMPGNLSFDIEYVLRHV